MRTLSPRVCLCISTGLQSPTDVLVTCMCTQHCTPKVRLLCVHRYTPTCEHACCRHALTHPCDTCVHMRTACFLLPRLHRQSWLCLVLGPTIYPGEATSCVSNF